MVMDSKQLALKFLSQTCDKMIKVCDKNIKSYDKKKTLQDLEKTFGMLLTASKEVFEEFNIDKDKVSDIVQKLSDKRKKEY